MDPRESKSPKVEESQRQTDEASQRASPSALSRREWLTAAGGALLVPGTQQPKSAKPPARPHPPAPRPVGFGSSALNPRACCT